MAGKLEQVWKVRLASRARSTTACGQRILSRVDDEVACFLQSGRLAWERRLPAEGWGRLHSYAGSVYLDTDPVLRLDPVSGRTLASRSLGPWPDLHFDSGWLTCNAGCAGRFLLVDPGTLETALSIPDETETHSLHNGLLCSQEGDERVIRDPWTGDEIARLSEPLYGHIHYRDCVCVFGDQDRLAIDLGTGAPAWQRLEPGPVRELRVSPGAGTVMIPKANVQEWTLRAGDLALVRGKALSAYDLRSGERVWRCLEDSWLGHWSLSPDGLLHVGGAAIHLVESWSGRVLGSGPPLDRELRSVVGLRGGLTIAECLTYDGNAHELRAFALKDEAASAAAPQEAG